MSISQKIKQLRKEENLTQKMLAKKIDVATSVIGEIETGKRMPSKVTSLKLAKYFNTTVDYWIDETETNNYISSRSKFSALEQVIKKLKEKGHIKNGKPTQEGWELIKEGLLIDLKFMDLNEKGE